MESYSPLDKDQDIKKNLILPRFAWQERRNWIKQQLIKTKKALEEAEREILQNN